MVDAKPKEDKLPRSCCAKCSWWFHELWAPMGHCAIHGEDRWYQCMVCDEYEVQTPEPLFMDVILGDV